MTFFSELKRRNVFRVAVMYLAVTWLSLQATDVLGSLLELPGWLGKVVFFLLLIGFPCALAFSWLYELTPDGLKRDSSLAPDETRRQDNAHRLNLLTIGAAILAVLAIVADRLLPEEEPRAVRQDQVVALAVLPFSNLSADKGQEEFADGITEEVLNLLANVQGLRVTSRTSSFSFKGQLSDLPTIARKLGVSHVVEGSVRTAGNRVRVTAQLIDVTTDAHIWSQTYEREITNVFDIQSDVAGQIARMLATALSADELSMIGKRPTSNLGAWQSFVSARSTYQNRTNYGDIERALSLVNSAIQEDPGFARAHSLKAALLLAQIAFGRQTQEPSTETYRKVSESARLALELAPELGEPYYILAVGASWQGRLDEADESFRKAVSLAPNNAEGRDWYGWFLLQLGYLERAWSEKQRAVELDPLSPIIFWQAAFAALTTNHLDAVQEFAEKSRDNGWTGWQPKAIQGGASLQLHRIDEAQAFYSSAFPDRADQIARAFDAIRNREIDAETRLLLDSLSVYGPPGIARWHVEVWAGDLDAAYASVRSVIDENSLENGTGSGNYLAPDWWFANASDFRKDPRFSELVRDVGLLSFWQQHGWPDLCEPSGESVICH